MFTILVTEKGGNQQRLEFEEGLVTFGRVQGNQVMLPRGNVSKRHAKLEFTDGAFMLTDLSSTNGTYVNGRRIAEPTRVQRGDKVYIGEFILGFEGHDAFEPEATAARPSAAKPTAAAAPRPKRKQAGAPRKASRPSVPRPSKADVPQDLPDDLPDLDDDDYEGDTELKSATVSSIAPEVDEMIPRADSPTPRTTEPSGRRIEALDSELGLAIEQLLDALSK